MLTFLATTAYLDISLAHWLVLLSVCISLSGALAYMRDMVRGKSKPNLVTWGLWAFAPLIATGAALSSDAGTWSTVRIFISGFGPLLIFVTAFIVKQGYWKLGGFDYACGALSLVALGVWLIADSPVLAILVAAVADLFATLPTLKKAWRYPETETLYTYFVGIFTASIVIPAIPVWNIENAAFQVYLLVANISLVFVVVRGYFLKKNKDLVYIDERGLLGSNFYWYKYEAKGLTKEDILSVGLMNGRVQVNKEILTPLLVVDTEFQNKGYRLYVKEGYRSKALYEIIYKRRAAKFGKEETDRIFNMEGMPHTLGTSVDVALWDAKENKEVYLRRGEDGMDALFVDFYKGKADDQSKKYQALQAWVIDVMQNNGFRLGTKREYFHFDYRPNEPRNYVN